MASIVGPSARAKEQTLIWTVDGQTLGGGFNKVTGFKETPDANLDKPNFVGQKVAEGDFDYNGTMLSWDTHHADHSTWQVWAQIIAADKAALPHPDITLSVVTQYRNGTSGTRQYKHLFMKLDSNDTPDRGYLKASWSAFSNDEDPDA
jgi:hypothetical protein